MSIYFIISIIEYGLLFSLLAVLVERLLIILGFARGNTAILVLVSLVLIIFKASVLLQ